MSANVETMFYNETNGVPWHGEGTPVQGLLKAKEALHKAGLDWRVRKEAIFCQSGPQVLGKYAIVRESDTYPLGIVGERYTPIQNEDAFSFIDTLVETGEAKYETAGSLGHGERIWILAKTPCTIEPIKGDPIETYLAFHTSHDGSKACGVFFTPIRVVCQNTLNAAVKGAASEYNFRHTPNWAGKVAEVRECLGFAVKYNALFSEAMSTLASRLVNADLTKSFVNAVIPEPKTEQEGRLDSWRERQDVLSSLVDHGRGTEIPGVRGTAYGLYQAAAEYADYKLAVRSQKAKAALYGGPIQQFKQKALDTALALV